MSLTIKLELHLHNILPLVYTTCAISTYHHLSWEFEPCSWWGVLDTRLCDKVCQWLATGRCFSPGIPVSSTNKTDSHDITAILLKAALNTMTQPDSFKPYWRLNMSVMFLIFEIGLTFPLLPRVYRHVQTLVKFIKCSLKKFYSFLLKFLTFLEHLKNKYWTISKIQWNLILNLFPWITWSKQLIYL